MQAIANSTGSPAAGCLVHSDSTLDLELFNKQGPQLHDAALRCGLFGLRDANTLDNVEQV